MKMKEPEKERNVDANQNKSQHFFVALQSWWKTKKWNEESKHLKLSERFSTH